MASGHKSQRVLISPCVLSSKPSPSALAKSKLCKFVSDQRFNRQINWTSALAQAAEASVLLLRVPETLIRVESRDSFLFTDKEGVVRVRKGDRSLDEFVLVCKENREKVRNLNPKGHKFPKFVTFEANSPEFTLNHKHDFGVYTEKPSFQVERFIVPPNFQIRKTAIIWRRTKVMKIFSISSKTNERIMDSSILPCTPDNCFRLNHHFIASTLSLDHCEVQKEPKITEECQTLVENVRQIVERFALPIEEQLEELVISVISAGSGNVYMLNAPKARTSQRKTVLSSLSLPTSRKRSIAVIESIEKRLTSSTTFPKLPKASTYDTFPTIFPVHSPYRRCETEMSDVNDARISEHLTRAAVNLDLLCKYAKNVKKESEIREKHRFLGYSPDFLTRAFHKMFENMSKHPTLSRFFHGKTEEKHRITSAMCEVFHHGRYPCRILEIHRKLNINEIDFMMYIAEFQRSFQSEGGREKDIEEAVSYLQSFKGCVVTKRRASILDLGFNE